MKNKVRRGFSKKTKSEKIEKAKVINQSALNNNETFANPTPSNEAYTTTITEAEVALNDVELAKEDLENKKAILEEKISKLDSDTDIRADYVDSISVGDLKIIAISGFDAKQLGGRSTVRSPEMVTILKILTGDKRGQIEANWQALKNVSVYQVDINDDINNPEGWHQVATPTKSSAVISDLESGKHYYLRVRAVNSHGEGPYSFTADKVVP